MQDTSAILNRHGDGRLKSQVPAGGAGGFTIDPTFEANGGSVSGSFEHGGLVTVSLPAGGFGVKQNGPMQFFWNADDAPNNRDEGVYPTSRVAFETGQQPAAVPSTAAVAPGSVRSYAHNWDDGGDKLFPDVVMEAVTGERTMPYIWRRMRCDYNTWGDRNWRCGITGGFPGGITGDLPQDGDPVTFSGGAYGVFRSNTNAMMLMYGDSSSREVDGDLYPRAGETVSWNNGGRVGSAIVDDNQAFKYTFNSKYCHVGSFFFTTGNLKENGSYGTGVLGLSSVGGNLGGQGDKGRVMAWLQPDRENQWGVEEFQIDRGTIDTADGRIRLHRDGDQCYDNVEMTHTTGNTGMSYRTYYSPYFENQVGANECWIYCDSFYLDHEWARVMAGGRGGHPQIPVTWADDEVVFRCHKPQSGEPAVIYDRNDNPTTIGVFN